MRITVNGDPKTLDDGVSVAELVVVFGLTPERVAVEVNERLVHRANYGQTTLSEGDHVEIVTLVGGG